MRNALLETFILVMKHFLMMSQDFLSHYYIYASSFIEDKECEFNKQVQKSIPLSVKEYNHKNLENVQKA